MGFLYGDAEIKYGDLAIKGEYITVDMDSSMISSTLVSTPWAKVRYPVFTEDKTSTR